jgi:hypothetical protein
MLKKILIGAVIVIVLLAAAMFYLNHRNRTLSPPGNASLTNNDLTVSISYSRPSVRGRVIFGEKEAGALQPYGAYWRLGANESTEITFNKDVSFNGEAVKAGTYRMYAVPKQGGFDIFLNSELGKWGAFEPDHTLDVVKTSVPSTTASASTEQYTISLQPAEQGIDILFEWSTTRWTLPIRM